MRIRGLVFSICTAALLAGCNTVEGVGRDISGAGRQMQQTSAMEKNNCLPTAYAGQKNRMVLKPPGMAPEAQYLAAPPAASSGGVTWNTIDNYDGSAPQDVPVDLSPISAPPSGAAAVEWNTPPAASAPGVAYSKDVTLFPLDGEAPTYTYTSSPYVGGSASGPSYDFYGQLVQVLYFQHGSSAISKADKAGLKQLASGVNRTVGDVSVTVVGHASKRVDGVSDPIGKKMINFEMAQKRADAVTRELKKSGVNPSWVRTVSKGDDAPNPAPGTRTQEEADRRAEIFMDSK